MKSNATTIIAIVAFCGAAFAAHRFMVMQKQHDQIAATDGDKTEAVQEDRTDADILDEIAQSLNQLAGLIGNTQAAKDLAAKWTQDVDQSVEELRKHAIEPSDPAVVRGRFEQLKAYYLATNVAPATYRLKLNELAQQFVTDHPHSEFAARATLLQFGSKYDLQQPLTADGIEDLKTQAAWYQTPALGVALYTSIAEQLHRNGQPKSAEEVLEVGMKQYKGHPERRKLFDLLLSQGHRDAPGSTLAHQGRFKNIGIERTKPGDVGKDKSDAPSADDEKLMKKFREIYNRHNKKK